MNSMLLATSSVERSELVNIDIFLVIFLNHLDHLVYKVILN
jgi:hypothetical protein